MRWLLGAVSLALALTGCTLSDLAPGSQDVERGSEVAAPGVDVGAWNVGVSVEPSRVQGLAVSAGPVRPAAHKAAVSHEWIEHDLVLENVGRRRLRLDGAHSPKAFIGPIGHRRRLLASAGVCFYTRAGPGSGFVPGCLAVIDETDLKPGASETVTITLASGIRGMEPLVAGTYAFDFRFRMGPAARPPGTDKEVLLRITYEIQRTGASL